MPRPRADDPADLARPLSEVKAELFKALAHPARVRALAPRARSEVAHGQMAVEELERVMQGFVSGEVDILVSTMIVESGLDVPNANTMVVHDAHRFGLAQLYQLRGRVGRSHRRAYCYLLVPDTIDADAEERLRVLEHHTDLGAGYRVACDCRKPAPGLLVRAAGALGADLARAWMVGDLLDDVEAGRRAGCRTVLVDSSGETEWRDGPQRRPHYRARDLAEAAEMILMHDRRDGVR